MSSVMCHFTALPMLKSHADPGLAFVHIIQQCLCSLLYVCVNFPTRQSVHATVPHIPLLLRKSTSCSLWCPLTTTCWVSGLTVTCSSFFASHARSSSRSAFESPVTL